MHFIRDLHSRTAKYFVITSLIISFIFFESCSAIKGNKYQTVPVTSRPSGAKIVVDGQEAGLTPLNLKLDKSKDHEIRIEKEGYQPVVIMIRPMYDLGGKGFVDVLIAPAIIICSALAGMGIWAMITSAGKEEPSLGVPEMLIAGILGMVPGAVYVASRFSTKKNAELSPGRLNILLEPTSVDNRAKVITLTPEQFEQLQWIRLSFVGGGEEEISLK